MYFFHVWSICNAQNTRGRWAIRPRELHNRPREQPDGGDYGAKLQNKKSPLWNYKIKIIFSDITLTQY